MTIILQTFDIWTEKAVESGDCRPNREDVGSRPTRQADNV
jgi:hypothetical protein